MSLIKRFTTIPAGLILLAAGAASPAYAAGDACKPVFDASDKVILTPAHLYVTRTASYQNKTTNGEMIYSGNAGGAIYILVNGKWRRSPITAGEMLKQEAENRATSKPATCQYLRDESVNGEAATVYSGRSENEAGKTAITIWISKSRGVPLKQEMEFDVGGSAGKSHQSTRYEYTNVRPPPGVQ
jgi:hypothetical protein